MADISYLECLISVFSRHLGRRDGDGDGFIIWKCFIHYKSGTEVQNIWMRIL